MDILHHENRLKREKYAWAYAAEARAKGDRLRAEQGRRRLLIEAGGFVPDDGLVTGSKAMAPPTHRLALKPVEEGSGARAIEVGPAGEREDEKAESSNSLVRRDDEAEDRALVRRAPGLNVPDISSTQLTIPNALPADPTTPIDTDDDGNSTLHEIPLDPASHLARALAQVGLPETAIVTRKGELVPAREVASGSGDGLGRGEADRQEREERERRVMGDEKDMRETLVPTWGYKVGLRQTLLFFRARRVDAPPPRLLGTERAHVWPGRRCKPCSTWTAASADGGTASSGSTRDSTCEYASCRGGGG